MKENISPDLNREMEVMDIKNKVSEATTRAHDINNLERLPGKTPDGEHDMPHDPENTQKIQRIYNSLVDDLGRWREIGNGENDADKKKKIFREVRAVEDFFQRLGVVITPVGLDNKKDIQSVVMGKGSAILVPKIINSSNEQSIIPAPPEGEFSDSELALAPVVQEIALLEQRRSELERRIQELQAKKSGELSVEIPDGQMSTPEWDARLASASPEERKKLIEKREEIQKRLKSSKIIEITGKEFEDITGAEVGDIKKKIEEDANQESKESSQEGDGKKEVVNLEIKRDSKQDIVKDKKEKESAKDGEKFKLIITTANLTHIAEKEAWLHGMQGETEKQKSESENQESEKKGWFARQKEKIGKKFDQIKHNLFREVNIRNAIIDAKKQIQSENNIYAASGASDELAKQAILKRIETAVAAGSGDRAALMRANEDLTVLEKGSQQHRQLEAFVFSWAGQPNPTADSDRTQLQNFIQMIKNINGGDTADWLAYAETVQVSVDQMRQLQKAGVALNATSLDIQFVLAKTRSAVETEEKLNQIDKLLQWARSTKLTAFISEDVLTSAFSLASVGSAMIEAGTTKIGSIAKATGIGIPVAAAIAGAGAVFAGVKEAGRYKQELAQNKMEHAFGADTNTGDRRARMNETMLVEKYQLNAIDEIGIMNRLEQGLTPESLGEAANQIGMFYTLRQLGHENKVEFFRYSSKESAEVEHSQMQMAYYRLLAKARQVAEQTPNGRTALDSGVAASRDLIRNGNKEQGIPSVIDAISGQASAEENRVYAAASRKAVMHIVNIGIATGLVYAGGKLITGGIDLAKNLWSGSAAAEAVTRAVEATTKYLKGNELTQYLHEKHGELFQRAKFNKYWINGESGTSTDWSTYNNNELKMDWGGVGGNGVVDLPGGGKAAQVSLAGMDTSWVDGDKLNVREAIQAAGGKIRIMLYEGTEQFVSDTGAKGAIFLDVDAAGNAIVPLDSPAGKLFSVVDGHMQLNGGFQMIAVADSVDTATGVHTVQSIAREFGHGPDGANILIPGTEPAPATLPKDPTDWPIIPLSVNPRERLTSAVPGEKAPDSPADTPPIVAAPIAAVASTEKKGSDSEEVKKVDGLVVEDLKEKKTEVVAAGLPAMRTKMDVAPLSDKELLDKLEILFTKNPNMTAKEKAELFMKAMKGEKIDFEETNKGVTPYQGAAGFMKSFFGNNELQSPLEQKGLPGPLPETTTREELKAAMSGQQGPYIFRDIPKQEAVISPYGLPSPKQELEEGFAEYEESVSRLGDGKTALPPGMRIVDGTEKMQTGLPEGKEDGKENREGKQGTYEEVINSLLDTYGEKKKEYENTVGIKEARKTYPQDLVEKVERAKSFKRRDSSQIKESEAEKKNVDNIIMMNSYFLSLDKLTKEGSMNMVKAPKIIIPKFEYRKIDDTAESQRQIIDFMVRLGELKQENGYTNKGDSLVQYIVQKPKDMSSTEWAYFNLLLRGENAPDKNNKKSQGNHNILIAELKDGAEDKKIIDSLNEKNKKTWIEDAILYKYGKNNSKIIPDIVWE
jgi:hypothetical protein